MSIIKVKTGGITADAITDALIADDVVGTEHLTANEVDTTALGADAVTAAQIADDAISEEHLDVTAITGHTAETSVADGDTILIHDASASALRKMTKANFVSGVGGDLTPAFSVKLSGNQTVNDATSTRVAWATEILDTDNAFTNTSGNYKFTVPSGEGGKYYVYAQVRKNNFSSQNNSNRSLLEIYNDSTVVALGENGGGGNYDTISVGGIFALNAADTLHCLFYHNHGNPAELRPDGSFFCGFKILGA